MNKMVVKILPFFFIGLMLVILVAGFILLSYLLIAGAVVGLVLFLVAWIKEKLWPERHLTKTNISKKTGRTIEHDDR